MAGFRGKNLKDVVQRSLNRRTRYALLLLENTTDLILIVVGIAHAESVGEYGYGEAGELKNHLAYRRDIVSPPCLLMCFCSASNSLNMMNVVVDVVLWKYYVSDHRYCILRLVKVEDSDEQSGGGE